MLSFMTVIFISSVHNKPKSLRTLVFFCIFLLSSVKGGLLNEMNIEAYSAGDMGAADYKSEIWVPITKS